jgi:hypothetical protein
MFFRLLPKPQSQGGMTDQRSQRIGTQPAHPDQQASPGEQHRKVRKGDRPKAELLEAGEAGQRPDIGHRADQG